MNPLVTTDEVRNGELLAQMNDAEYRIVSVVYKLNGNDTASFYCSERDWLSTEAGRTAALHAEIARLRARVLELESNPVTVEEAIKMTVAVPSVDWPYCPECNAGPFIAIRGWKAHRRIKHGVR